MNTVLNFAHRGASAYCPENTMAAFQRALELGATGIETDVQMTSDGHLVLIHDESLQRTAGSPKLVKDVTLEELKLLDAGSWFGPQFADERIPTLRELLELVKPHEGVQINIELKNGIALYPGLENAVIEEIRLQGLSERIIISSFNHYSLALCKQLAPEVRTGVLYAEGLYEPWEYAARLGASALHAYHYAVLPEWAAQAAEQGIVYHPWTVNEPAEMMRLLKAGVAGIITDYPDRLGELIKEYEA
ncbi:glycerophosphoryl diester phosphodiesterase [Paenibacillus cellulosilyticus]|uniref:Glycerophosphoryl diester phosphodiesterase n=1 Tax=Paenibacillus cellulosilyticus TaxID=375489 RepID=A0A2V2YTR1_9BACL|nr:glycerophosphodiester phosphodiesterase [Paenibacillus cellulosilyticus]PWW02805.1 glycerophosphoryl diester phosphodiesterase [Paenibacillus cellulosilyticus]QKS45727.1 glycerophosphodiester phosphodiesterase [Paenibacillus cellulosilyticus]